MGVGVAYPEEAHVRELSVFFDSGKRRVIGKEPRARARAIPAPIWSKVIEAPDADWVRLRFGQVMLAKSTEHVRESDIRVTSLEDGYEQYLDAGSIEAWGHNSSSTYRVQHIEFNIADFVDLTQAFRVRISAPDSGTDTTVEDGIDAVRIASEVRNNACLADLTGDGAFNFFDVSAFLNAFNAGCP